MHTFEQPPAGERSAASPAHTATVASVRAARPNAPEETEIATLLEAAENVEQKRRTVKKYAGFLLAFWFASVFSWIFWPSPWTGAAALITSFWGLTFGTLFWMGRLPAAHLSNAVAPLHHFPDESRLLLPLIDALNPTFVMERQTPEWKNAAYPLLTEHLWNLSANDAALSLDETRRAVLRHFLGNAYAFTAFGKRKLVSPDHFDDVTTDLAVAIIKTLAGIGDAKTVKMLEKILKAKAETPNEAVVHDAISEYLPALQQKITENANFRLKVREYMGKTILDVPLRDPQKVLAELVDTLSPEDAKVALVNYLNFQIQLGKFFSVLVGVWFPFGVAYILKEFYSGEKPSVALVLFCVATTLALTLFTVEWPLYGRRCAAVSYELVRRSGNDTRLLPLLLNAARTPLGKKTNDAITKALVRLLPQLKPGDAALVPPAQRAYLRSWLSVSKRKNKAAPASQTLAIVALDALAALGDTRALPRAKQIARQTAGGTYRETELHEAALRCVEALQKR